MIKKLLKPWPLRLFLSKISWFVITATGIFIIIITLISIYGKNVGGLLIALDYKTQYALSLSETETFEDKTTLLNVKGIGNLRDVTYADVPENIEEGSGQKSDTDSNPKYFAYSFYLKNESEVAVGYNVDAVIVRESKDISSAVRVMIITDGDREIYAKAKSDGTPETHLGPEVRKPYVTTPFVGQGKVCSYQVPTIGVNEVKKYTIVLWLEGWDEQCTNDILGAYFQLDLTFSIVQ